MDKYKTLKNTYNNSDTTEYFFVSYAVEGPIIVPSYGLRAGLPVDTPIKGPVKEPSPLNTRWIYNNPDKNMSGIL